MSNDESRRQFEELFGKWHPDMTRANNGLNYADPTLDVCWIAWQASRQAIEIDLPKACAGDEYFIDGVFQPMRYERDVERTLSAAGLKIKGEP